MAPKQNISLIKKSLEKYFQSVTAVAMFTTGHIFSTLEDPLN